MFYREVEENIVLIFYLIYFILFLNIFLFFLIIYINVYFFFFAFLILNYKLTTAISVLGRLPLGIWFREIILLSFNFVLTFFINQNKSLSSLYILEQIQSYTHASCFFVLLKILFRYEISQLGVRVHFFDKHKYSYCNALSFKIFN
jgi:hypothetical protein